MKITTNKDRANFTPLEVTILCETQGEVDALYALGNMSGNTRLLVLGKRTAAGKSASLSVVCNSLYEALESHSTKE